MTDAPHDHKAWLLGEIAKLQALIPQQLRDGERDQAIFNIESCLTDMIEYAALDSHDAAGCAERLVALNAGALFREYLPLADPRIINAHQIDFVAIPILLGEIPLAVEYVRTRLVSGRCTKFWMEYVRALACLADGAPYAEAPLKSKNIETYWREYLPYIAARSIGTDPSEALASIRIAFEKFNRDRRIWNHGIFDPSGNRPVAWDCRLAYLSAFADGVAAHSAVDTTTS